MMKAHGALRNFLLYKLEAASLGTSAESLIRKDRIRTNILNVETMISRLKIHPKLNKQVRNELKDLYSVFKIIFLDPDAPFFCNFNGGQLSAIRNTSGSLWDIFGKETGLDHVTVNTLRRGAEDHVQKNQVSRKRIAILQGHSEDVGRGWIIMIVGPQIIVPAFQL